MVVKREAEESATDRSKETLAPCDCEVWTYRAPQPDRHVIQAKSVVDLDLARKC
jgi:hypothetical protein